MDKMNRDIKAVNFSEWLKNSLKDSDELIAYLKAYLEEFEKSKVKIADLRNLQAGLQTALASISAVLIRQEAPK